MTATANTIWRVPAYLPYLQPPLTVEAIASAEKEIGYKLPKEYLDLLKVQNGGYLRYTLPETVHDKIAGIGPNFPSLTDFNWEECQEYVSYPLQGLVPFDGDGHWHLCLDYRQNAGAPAVTHVDVECDHEYPVAESFAAYLAMLEMDDIDDVWVVEAVPEIGKFESVLSAALGIQFDPPDTFTHGYPIHGARVGDESDRQWVWLSPNTVPRGFVRPNDRRYAELKDLLPGFAPRYPEAPADGCILSATDAVQSKVLRACVQAGMAIRPLRDYVLST